MIDYSYLFEKVVKAVFGKPKTFIYFTNFRDGGNQEYKYILFTICVYILNYDENITNEEREKLEQFISSESIYLDDREIVKILDLLKGKYNII